MSELRAFFRTGIQSRPLLWSLAIWVLVAVGNGITLPMRFPLESAGRVLDSSTLVSLVVPIVMAARILDEGPAALIGTASRILAPWRLVRVVLFSVTSAAGVLLTASVAPLPLSLVGSNALLLVGATMAGVGAAGVARAWMLPLALLACMSSPGLVPWQFNIFFRVDIPVLRFAMAAGMVLLGTLLYLGKGSYGLLIARELRTSDLQMDSD